MIGKPHIELLLRLIIGGIFLIAGTLKLDDPAAFQGDIANFRLLPWGMAGAVALYLPWLEIVGGGCLVVRRMMPGCLLLLSLLTVAFGVFVVSAWIRGLDISCGCFGRSGPVTHFPLATARVALMLTGLFAIAWLFKRSGRPQSRESQSEGN